jgi:hypothetical protein
MEFNIGSTNDQPCSSGLIVVSFNGLILNFKLMVEDEDFNQFWNRGFATHANDAESEQLVHKTEVFIRTDDFIVEENMHEVKKEVWAGGKDLGHHGKGFKSWKKIILNSS